MAWESDGGTAFRIESNLQVGRAFLKAGALLAVMTLGLWLIFPGISKTLFSGFLTQKFWNNVKTDPRTYLGPLALIATILWLRLRVRYERLYVSSRGLRYVSPLGGKFTFLDRFHPSWSLSWSDVDRVELQAARAGLNKYRYSLVIASDSLSRRIEYPLSWIPAAIPPVHQGPLPRRDDAAMRQRIMKSPLVQAFKSAGVQVVERPGLVRPAGALKGYDISQDKQLLLAVGLLLLALVYYLVDTFMVWQYMALENLPVWPYVLMGPLGVWFGLHLGRQAPRLERYLISVMLGGALCAAAYPLMLRLNALTAPSGNDLYQYTQLSPGSFKANTASLPQIYFAQQTTYWSHFPNGTTHEFRVFKGAMGFYELDTGRVQQEVSAWWATQKFK